VEITGKALLPGSELSSNVCSPSKAESSGHVERSRRQNLPVI